MPQPTRTTAAEAPGHGAGELCLPRPCAGYLPAMAATPVPRLPRHPLVHKVEWSGTMSGMATVMRV